MNLLQISSAFIGMSYRIHPAYDGPILYNGKMDILADELAEQFYSLISSVHIN